MKKWIAVGLAVALGLLCCGCGKGGQEVVETEAAAVTVTETEALATEQTAPVETTQAATVDISLSADQAGEVTQEQMDAAMVDGSVQFAKRYDNGSVVYRVTPEQHAAILAKVRAAVDAELERMLSSGEYTFTDIQPDGNYAKFTVLMPSEELGMMDSFSVLELYTYGQLYQAYNGTRDTVITVEFVNEATGAVIETASSADMK